MTLKDRENVTCYVSDMADYLLRLGKYFPNATIVADPFHVVRSLRNRFDELIRPFEGGMLDAYILAIKDLHIVRPVRPSKRKKKSRPEPLPPTEAEIRILLHTKLGETNQTQRKALKYLLKRFPDVRHSYCYLQRVMLLYHTSKVVTYVRDDSELRTATVKNIDAVDASIALDKFEARLKPHIRADLRIFLDTCRKNRDFICAFWSMGWANAETEAQNRVINEIDRMGRG